jgi:hypothetical protein
MKKMLFIPLIAASMMLSACAGLLSAMLTGSTAPPQAPAQVINISRGAVDFALNSFDAALYGLDFAMDAGKLVPGSAKAKSIAAAGRKVMQALGAAEAARDAANSTSYEEAFANANMALKDFRALIGNTPTAGLTPADMHPLSPSTRTALLDRLATAA